MTVQTKFDIDQRVWLMENNQVKVLTVNKIEVVVTSLQSTVRYGTSRCEGYFTDEVLFPSKAALLESL